LTRNDFLKHYFDPLTLVQLNKLLINISDLRQSPINLNLPGYSS